jgi:hypothetical protein
MPRRPLTSTLGDNMRRTIPFLVLITTATAIAAPDAPQADQGPWWIGFIVTIAAAVIGALAIVWQMGKQHKNESLRQNENFKSQLKLQVYQEFSDRLSSASAATQSASIYALTAPTHVEIYQSQVARGFNPQPIEERASKLLEINSTATNEVVETIFLIEKYLIIHADLDLFRLALSSAAHDVWEAFHPLFQFMLSYLPMDVQSDHGPRVENVLLLSEEQKAQLKELTNNYHDATVDLGCYLDDMRTELQMLLLSHLFSKKLQRRRPVDPSKKALSLEPELVNGLRQHFLKHTPWGKKAIASQLAVHNEFHGLS